MLLLAGCFASIRSERMDFGAVVKLFLLRYLDILDQRNLSNSLPGVHRHIFVKLAPARLQGVPLSAK